MVWILSSNVDDVCVCEWMEFGGSLNGFLEGKKMWRLKEGYWRGAVVGVDSERGW